VERRTYIHASPLAVWAALHDPASAVALFPGLVPGPAEPAWPAASATRTVEVRFGLLRECARAESLEARPAARFRMRVTASGFSADWIWSLDAAMGGGTRVIHGETFDPFDPWTGILVRLGRGSLADRVEGHLRVLKERAEAGARPPHTVA
jgi:hypothetical protein